MLEAEEKNKALVRRLWEADARGDLKTLDELLEESTLLLTSWFSDRTGATLSTIC